MVRVRVRVRVQRNNVWVVIRYGLCMWKVLSAEVIIGSGFRVQG